MLSKHESEGATNYQIMLNYFPSTYFAKILKLSITFNFMFMLIFQVTPLLYLSCSIKKRLCTEFT